VIRLTLPYPVSANRYWRQFFNPRARHVMQGPSTEAQSYKREVASIARQAGIRTPLVGRVEVRYWLVPHAPSDAQKRARLDPDAWDLGVQCLDLDNAQKVLMDSLKGVVFEDDRLVHRIVAERAAPGQKGLIVEIEPFTPSWLRDKPTPLNG
jgi:crossover junction endodeoxyribonuclease RusA